MLTRSLYILLFLCCMSVLLTSTTAYARFPARPLTYIVPFHPGGSAEKIAKIRQDCFQKTFNTPMNIVFEPGADGAVGWTALNLMSPDGYKVMVSSIPQTIIQPKRCPLGYQAEDVAHVHFSCFSPDALVVRAKSPIKTVDDFVQMSQRYNWPLALGGLGVGTAHDTAKAQFDHLASIRTAYCSFSSTAALSMALQGGRLAAVWGSPAYALQQGERVRVLAIASEKRHPKFPDVPTFKELGYTMVSGEYRGIAVPVATPDDIRRRVAAAMSKITKHPEFKSRMEAEGFNVVDISYDDIGAFVQEQSQVYDRIYQQLASQ